MKRLFAVLLLLISSTSIEAQSRQAVTNQCFYSNSVTYLVYNTAEPTLEYYQGSSSYDANLIRSQADSISTNGFWSNTRFKIPPSVITKVEVVTACP